MTPVETIKAARGFVVDDEQFFALRASLGERAARYHGFRGDFLDGCGRNVVIWPVDPDLSRAVLALKGEGIEAPEGVRGYEAAYVSRRAAVLRGLDRAKFGSGRWGCCLGRWGDTHAPLGFFTTKKDARTSQAAARRVPGLDPTYRPEAMEVGGEDDDGKPIRPDAQAAFARGRKLAGAGKHAPARAAFEQVVTLEPSFEQAHEQASLMSREIGDFKAMLKTGLARCKRFQRSPDAWMDVSIARQNLGALGGALSAIERAIAIDPTNGTLEYQKACVHAIARRPSASLRAIARALEMDRSLAGEIRRDEDFALLRDRPAFQALFGRQRRAR